MYKTAPGIEPEKRTWKYVKYVVGLVLIGVVVFWFCTDTGVIVRNVEGFWRHWTGTEKSIEEYAKDFPAATIYHFKTADNIEIEFRTKDGNLVKGTHEFVIKPPEGTSELMQLTQTQQRIALIIKNSIRETAVNFDAADLYNDPSKFRREAIDNLSQDLWEFGIQLEEMNIKDFKYTDEFLGKARENGTIPGSN